MGSGRRDPRSNSHAVSISRALAAMGQPTIWPAPVTKPMAIAGMPPKSSTFNPACQITPASRRVNRTLLRLDPAPRQRNPFSERALPESAAVPARIFRRRVIVRGRVQGVWFRESVRRLAEGNQVAGWVRNRPDGTVEAVFEGRRESVEELERFCHGGPPYARVDSVEAKDEDATGETGFRVR